MFSSSVPGTHSPTHTLLWAKRYWSRNSCPQNCEGIKVSLCGNGQPVAICSSSPRRLIYLDTLQSPIHPLLLKGKLLTANKPIERRWKIPLLWPNLWHLPPLCPSLSLVVADCLFSCYMASPSYDARLQSLLWRLIWISGMQGCRPTCAHPISHCVVVLFSSFAYFILRQGVI